MSTHFSAAQVAQQNNRSSDGKYAHAQHQEPAGVDLAPDTAPTQAERFAELHLGLVDGGVDSATAQNYICAQTLIQLHDQWGKEAKGHLAAGNATTSAAFMLAQAPIRDAATRISKGSEDPDVAEKALDEAKRSIDRSFSLFDSFGRTPMSIVADDTRRLVTELAEFVEIVKKGGSDNE